MPIPTHLLDGGLGTTLTQPPYSCVFGDETPLWSSHLLISDPQTLLTVQTAFAKAGADIILTATYQTSYEGFILSGVKDEKDIGQLMRSAVRIARSAFVEEGRERSNGKVALSLGAYGACMIPSQEYTGRYDTNHLDMHQLCRWHFDRLSVFLPEPNDVSDRPMLTDQEIQEKEKCWNDIDFIAFETLPLLMEILGVRMCVSLCDNGRAYQKPFWISCVFPGDENKLPDGSTIKQVVEAMLAKTDGAAKPMGIGVNCTGVEKIERLILEFEDTVGEMVAKEEVDEWPALVVYPDGTKGEVYNTISKQWEVKNEEKRSLPPWDETIYAIVRRTRERGLWKEILVGGCCQTKPEDIQKLRQRIDLDK